MDAREHVELAEMCAGQENHRDAELHLRCAEALTELERLERPSPTDRLLEELVPVLKQAFHREPPETGPAPGPTLDDWQPEDHHLNALHLIARRLREIRDAIRDLKPGPVSDIGLRASTVPKEGSQ